MSGNTARLESIATIESQELFESFDFEFQPTTGLFGVNTFSKAEMKKRLPKNIYKTLMKTVEDSEPLDESVADAVASAMKDWAMERGVTHFAHVFYPLTGLMAEKHDGFNDPDGDGNVIAEFSGATLMQGEPDGSSFPSGGIRQTHEARGYTAWDPTSPAFIIENPNGATLCVPTSFVSWTGQTTDYKTPLLRSMQALDQQARRVLGILGEDDQTRVISTAGPEQEYFLVDTSFVNSRIDLYTAGRTVFGATPAKGQQFDDHYFGPINPRIQACMFETERELYKLGVPVKTRHNEVAPGQYELAPVYQNGNVAADQQQLIMLMLKRVAKKHGLTALLHEKPFAGINGSGKHLNFSLGNGSVGNLFEPGETPHSNARFLLFCAAVIRSVDKYAPLLRAGVATASNDHRLGANEAPPAIMSIFLGDQLTDVFDQIKEKGNADSSIPNGVLDLGVDILPNLPLHSGDRNRTSPIAFTGNKFEFRAVGSTHTIAWPLTIWNTILAESLDFIASELEGADDLSTAINGVLKGVMDSHSRVIFNGDGYSDEWHKEAEFDRGLPNLRTSADALPVLGTPEMVELFGKYSVLNETELLSRLEVLLEQYVMTVGVESDLVMKMGKTIVLPAAVRYAGELASAADDIKDLGLELSSDALEEVVSLANALQAELKALAGMLEHEDDDLAAEAAHAASETLPQMLKIREIVDALEVVVADDLWALPSYQEMLFIR
ncbi:MAG: glutamine synthetase III [Chloroflexota bacterium]